MTWDICPQADFITQGFGCTDFTGEWYVTFAVCNSQRFHAGIDLGRSDGGANLFRCPVYATRPGTVVQIGLPYLGDQAVVLRTDGKEGVYIEYGHLDQALVAVGDHVDAGTQIGLVGTKGNSTGPHLHVEVRADGPVQGTLGNPNALDVQALFDPTPYLTSTEETLTPELQAALTALDNHLTQVNGGLQNSLNNIDAHLTQINGGLQNSLTAIDQHVQALKGVTSDPQVLAIVQKIEAALRQA